MSYWGVVLQEGEDNEDEEDAWEHRRGSFPSGQDLKDKLLNHLQGVHSAGTFATLGSISSFTLPGISIMPRTSPTGESRDDGDTRSPLPRLDVGLPLSPEDARRLIEVSCQAPFGKANRTVVDTTVRNTWEIEAANIRFRNPDWDAFLRQLINKAASELGVSCSVEHVRAELHKMLIYEKGDMFKAHQDTEKASGMFGTLVVCLPSAHVGGAVALLHGKRTLRFRTDDKSTFGITYMAWYGDVRHEIEPVIDGYRWVLTYNLIKDPGHGSQSAARLDEQTNELNKLLSAWHVSKDVDPVLVIPLEHQYSNASLGLANLKGNDFHRVTHASQTCANDGRFYALLANLDLTVNAPDEESYWEDEDEDEDDDEGEEAGFVLTHVVDVMILSRKRSVLSVLSGGSDHEVGLDKMFRKAISRHEALSKTSAPDDLLLQLCSSTLRKYQSAGPIGPVAVTALRLKDADLFVRAVKRSEATFSRQCWVQLGSQMDLTSLLPPEDCVIEALTKSKKLYTIHEAITAFRQGQRQRPDQSAETAYREGWLTKVLLTSMEQMSTVAKHDPRALIDMITDQRQGLQQFMIFQGVRKLVKRMLDHDLLPTALLFEICTRCSDPCHLSPFFHTLVRTIAESGFPGLTLQRCVDHPGWKYSSLARTLYQAVEPQHRPVLLQKLQASASIATDDQLQEFIPQFIKQMSAVVDGSLPEVHACFQAFVTHHIVHTLGKEPIRPMYRLRPEPTTSSRWCKCYDKVNDFLKDPKRNTFTINCAHNNSNLYWSLQGQHLDLFRPQNDATMTVRVSKPFTSRNWEKLHAKWVSDSEALLAHLRRLPNLRQCLGDGYDSIMGLSMARAETQSVATSNMPGASSIVPQKRELSDI